MAAWPSPVEVMVINPKAITLCPRLHATGNPLVRLIDYTQRMPLPWQPPRVRPPKALRAFKRDLIAERCRLQAEGYRGAPTALIAGDIQVHIRHLQRRIDRLEEQAHAVVETTPALQTPFQRLLSIPGIGPTSAVRLGRISRLARRYEAAPMGRLRRLRPPTPSVGHRPGRAPVDFQSRLSMRNMRVGRRAPRPPYPSLLFLAAYHLGRVEPSGPTSMAKNSIETPHKTIDQKESISYRFYCRT